MSQIVERKTLELIEQIEDETAGWLPESTAQRLAGLRQIIVAGAPLTTMERIEVSELWDKHVR